MFIDSLQENIKTVDNMLLTQATIVNSNSKINDSKARLGDEILEHLVQDFFNENKHHMTRRMVCFLAVKSRSVAEKKDGIDDS
jgi:hypothetical protein